MIDDPLDGFLPPNKTSPEGEGFISYSVLPKKELAHGTEIKNKATIYFDTNAPIVTNEFLNTIDKQNPASNITALPPETQDTTFTVNWSGTDAGAGVRSYDVYYAVNNGPFRLWQYDVTAAAGKFAGKIDSSYAFYSIAKDYAGNIEQPKTTAEAATTVVKRVTGLPGNLPDGFTFKSYPNPTDSKVLLEFTLPTAEHISLILYDVLGRRTTVMKDKKFGAGTHTVPYDLKQFPAGMYICELKGEKFTTNLKILKQ
ncbi:T9SS type A sorting domain-containing protein [Adhaeribacter arboris]